MALVRRLDDELDGAISELRKKLHLRGKPQEVLFLCCCILDLEPEMIAEIMDTTKGNVYQKRSRLRARIREYGTDAVLRAIEKIRCSSFLRGQNAKGWVISFEWFVRPNNFPKVLEGNYDDTNGQGIQPERVFIPTEF